MTIGSAVYTGPRLQEKQLNVLAYTNGFTLWHFKCMVSPHETIGSEFWYPAREVVRVGDLILQTYNDPEDAENSFATIRMVTSIGPNGPRISDLFCDHLNAGAAVLRDIAASLGIRQEDPPAASTAQQEEKPHER